ncbi:MULTISPECIES: hypothetical protein [Rhodanobacter]|uniref:hypothetical protein n=1 Tax=Rhodanobacter TaxID=75309 RepID=UPI0003FBF857|nr:MULTISPECIES: hypothetical protein [Rhodanobacter]KZC19361.1 hypothetical protein RHOFW104R3_31610 [Rhodanobacter denitrificans]UJJ52920.1 hypothetical protein LRK52_12830 [Rhodanobacter denitrificans]UJM95674.1 hypothetical protein LRK32_12745 [Rhodanobacter denitrificans]UJM99205.1 hypothetical protein LRK44_12750 [Rhodanobacter denitrificans]UJN23423.1 hypothetical protein LRK54_13890 [Rhodanobacter denitrificans]
MTQLRLEQAPTPSLPRRFLLGAPCWGMLAGALLIVDGEAALRMRWNPATLALVHVFTLGVLGNAMLGSVLQFLPAAAGVRVRGSAVLGPWLHGLFNLGVLLLVAGLHQHWRLALIAAALLLPLAFVLLAAMTVPGLLATAGQRLLRAGFGVAIGFAVLTALLGGLLALGLAGRLALPLAAIADVHAGWGVLGWVVVLMASVARVVMPMFQGTGTVREPMQAAWLGSAVLMLLGAAIWRLVDGGGAWLVGTVAVLTLAFAVAGLWLQWRAPRLRRGPLLWSWRAGLMVLALAALALLADVRGGMLAGALGLGVALPLLVTGMMLEIVPFIGWIELHRRIGRGVQLPGVQRLLPVPEKTRALLAQLPLLLLPTAVLWPSAWLARVAGLALVLAWGSAWWTLRGVRRRAHLFLSTVEARP